MDRQCPAPETWIAFYGGETEEGVTRRLAAHLQECPRCQREFDGLCRMGAGIRDAIEALPQTRPNRSPLPRRRPVPSSRPLGLPLAVAAALAVAAVGLILLRGPGRTPTAQAPAVPQDRPAAEDASKAPAPPPPSLPAEEEAKTVAAPPPAVPAEVAARPPAPPPPAPAAPDPVPPEAPPATARPSETTIAVATLEVTEGEVWVTTPAGREPARKAQPLLAGQGLAATGPKSRALVKFPDGTRMELGGKSALGRILDRGGAKGIGTWVDLSEGSLTVEASRQPADRAMSIATPHAEARILGTALRLVVEPGEKGSTRLEVMEGKVRLTRPRGGVIDVAGGYYAVAGQGADLAARPLPGTAREILYRFDLEDGRLPKICRAGAVEKGPERAGSRFCIAGTVDPEATSGGRMTLVDDARGLMAFREDIVISFDYWVDDTVSTLDVQIWSRSQQLTFGTTVWNTPRQQWTHVVIPLPELVRPEGNRILRMKPGDSIITFWIQAGQVGGALYIDNLEIARVRPAPPKPSGKGK